MKRILLSVSFVAILLPLFCNTVYAEETSGIEKPVESTPQIIDFSVTLIKEKFKAFDSLEKDDYTVSAVYSDGSVGAITNESVRVIYENGESFRKGDSMVGFLLGELEYFLPVSVDCAEYEMINVRWENIELTYNGEIQHPILCGLPDGVTVGEYIGGGINSGEYSVSAVLDYDKENYKEPIIDPCDYKIKKKELAEPSDMTAEYNGNTQIPSCSEYYIYSYEEEIKNSGEYKISVKLTDPENYCFPNDKGDRCEIILTVKPCILYLEVENYKLYLFEKLGSCDYKIISGELKGDDTLNLNQIIDGESISLVSKDNNYVLVGNSAQVIRINRLNPRAEKIFLLITVSIITVGIVCLTIVKWRGFKRFKGEKLSEKGYITETGVSEKEPEYKRTDGEFLLDAEKSLYIDGLFSYDARKADELISDSLAKSLLRKSGKKVYTNGRERGVVYIDTLCKHFESGDFIDINLMKAKGIVTNNVSNIKVLARGELDKPLTVYANEFSPSAIKMIALLGGEAVLVKNKRKIDN